MSQKNRQKRKQEKKRRTNAHKNTFRRYVESTREFDLPPANASQEVLIAYVKRLEPLIEEHADEVGSGSLAWRAGTVLNWLKERCDNGQLVMPDGSMSTFVPPDERTFEG